MTKEYRTDVLTQGLMARYAHMLDRSPSEGEAPQGIHWCLCTPEVATQALGEDGHPAGGGGYLPVSPLPRRMWASSELEFIRPLEAGATVTRISSVLDAKEKQGGSGALLFVTVGHETLSNGSVAIRETQTIVYREAAAATAGATGQAAAEDIGQTWPWRRAIIPNSRLLFRYSALTFNSHRIHYDLPYARDVEGYPGLVVHGPLMASLLLDLADRELGSNRLRRFSFRARNPAFVDEELTLVGRPEDGNLSLAVLGSDGRMVMSAEATLAG